MLATGAMSHAHAGMTNLGNVSNRAGAAQGGVAGRPGPANLGMGVSPQQALQASQPSIRNLAAAARGIAQQIAAQQAAAAAGLAAPSNVPNGLTPGGLQVAPGVTADTNNANLWYNANLPTQTVNPNGTVDVDVKQNGANAVLTWQTMNVGKQTTLNFDQSGGTQVNGANNWVVLNRIQDPTGAPSQILGKVNAQGTVLVINRNGILFGAGSQVNVHSLVASSLDLLNLNDYKDQLDAGGPMTQSATDIVASNQAFLNGGLAAVEAGTSSTVPNGNGGPTEILGLGNVVSVSSTSQLQTPGDITIEPGALITTAAQGNVSNGGFVVIAAPNVTNGGDITVAPTGQVVLAAGVGVSLIPNSSTPQLLQPELTGRVGLGADSTDITPAGTLINTGIIQAQRGNINLLGSSVAQNGVVGVTTDVNTPGNIQISTVDENIANTPTGAAYVGKGIGPVQWDVGTGGIATNRAGALTIGEGSVTTVLPDADGASATSSPGQTTFSPGSITMTAGSVWFQSGSLVEAPGSKVSIAALTPSVTHAPPGDTAIQGRIYVDNGATIDVSGLANVELPISAILLDVGTINANDLANSPLLRDSFLNGLKGVIVDSTLSGTNADGLPWVGSPILNLAGAVSLIPRTIDQLLTNGGSITLSGNEVMTASGSSLNLNGGYVHYLGGMVNTTRLVDANGAIVPIGQASPYDNYVGIAGQFVDNHPRWGVRLTYLDPLLSAGVYEGDYIVGGNAGTLNVFASQTMVLDGSITGQAFGGSKQVQGNDQPIGGTFNLGANPAAATQTSLSALTQGASSTVTGESGTVILQDTAPQLSDLLPGFSADTPLTAASLGSLSSTDPNNLFATTVVPVGMLNDGGFSNVSISEDNAKGAGIVVAAGTQLAVQPGGSIKLSSPNGPVNVQGSLVAPSGTVSISSGSGLGGGGIVVGSDAVISVAGQWVNNDTQTAADTALGSSEFINGGSISLSTTLTGSAVSGQPTDTTGSIILQPGSLLDVSSGGEVQANGQMLMQNGIAEGTAGSLSLITYAGNTTNPFGSERGPLLPAGQPMAGQIEMDGTIRSFGFSGGGTLTLQALGFQLGGDPSTTPAWDLYLPASFFAQQGFGKYVLNAMYDINVAPGATIAVTQHNLIPDAVALQAAPTGSDISAAGLTTVGTVDPFHRQATDLEMTAGGYLAWQSATGRPDYSAAGVTGGVTVGAGASIVADAGANIGIGSPAQVTVLGSIIAPGGSITLSADSTGGAFALPGQEISGDAGFGGYTSASKSVWLGSNAVLDVAGVTLTDPLAAPVREGVQSVVPNTGKILPGGSITLSDDTGYVIAEKGAVVNVSGATGTLDELQAGGRYVAQQVWSDAGSITLGVSDGLLFDGTLLGKPGAAQAQGGTLTITELQSPVTVAQADGTQLASPGAKLVLLQQSGDLVPAGLAPGQVIPGGYTATVSNVSTQQVSGGVNEFSVDTLSGSGISTLIIGNGSLAGTAPTPVAFAGNVALELPASVEINTGQLVALSSDQASKLFAGQGASTSTAPQSLSDLLSNQPASIGTTVSIDAPYVALVGPQFANGKPIALSPAEMASDATFNVHASFIDLENQLQLNNFGQANFVSSGDIRLTSTNAVADSSNALTPGELFTRGNLTFQAADVYPSTGSTFIIDAVGLTDASTGNPAPTTVTFLSNGSSGVPLSAGGTLLVDATDIVQSGTVRAPSGSLIFGVGDTSDAGTQTQFNSLPLVATNSVALGSGSVTSVSLDNTVVPFGTTVDGVEWQFNPVPNFQAAPDLTGPPAKFVSLNGSTVSLNQGATVDLSGGGNLQAEEWVQGTGGTRDVLSQYNVSFATTPSGVAVPTNIGASNIYAILPGKQTPVAAYDPVFAQTVQPSTNANGSVSTTTDSIGVGHSALDGAVGQSVYLSGVPGLAAGYYTLLPAKYATLPGAYRVTVSSTPGAVAAGSSQTLSDGTVVVAGYMGNSLNGSRSATPTLFNVQSGAVWQQYSQYTTTNANAFFPQLAAHSGNVTPPLPMDAGQLVLAASKGLQLGATLDTAAAPGGAPAEVDIASQNIQIVGNGETALPGYLQISSDQLNALDAGSLLIGGIRTQTSSGITIDPVATNVVVSNDAANPLTGPEIILVSSNNLQVDPGSVIAAKGSYPAAKDLPITIGQNADSTTGATAVSGDGALLSVSNGGPSVVTRLDTSGTGVLTVGAGAALTGGQALTLDSSGNLTFDPAATLSGNTIAVDGSAITFTDQTGAAAAALPGFVVGATQLAQLANAQNVILRSAGAMNFDGNVDVTFGKNVDLSAGTFVSDGGSTVINANEVAFTNEMGAPVPASTSGSGSLTVNASEIDLGSGNRTVNGFGAVTMNATAGIVGQGTGTFDFGAVPLTLNAPVFLADTGSSQTIKTTGVLNLNAAAGTALALNPVGGAISFAGGTLNDNGATIAAPAGNVSLEATTGDLNVASGALISSAGVSKQFFDVTEYAPAGSITLTADAGSVNLAAGSTVDFSGAQGGGAAGSLNLSAPQQVVNLGGTIKGNAASGFAGGSFSLDTGGAVDLDGLSKVLASSGVTKSINVETGAGNLTLSAGNTLTALNVSLTADGGAGNASDTANGNVNINGTINANGVATASGGAQGGTIDLYGRSGVDVEGTLLAEGSDAYLTGSTINPNSTQLGGTINIGTSGTPTGTYNAQYGYENVDLADSGRIRLGNNAHIDVSGGGIATLISDGLMGGVINLRAPLLSDGATNGGRYVNVDLDMTGPNAGITGARAVNMEAYAVWSTTDATTGAQHFDSVVDPAGYFSAPIAGQPIDSPYQLLVSGTFTDQSGNAITYTAGPNGSLGTFTSNGTTTTATADQIQTDLENDFFVPTSANADHQQFYGSVTTTNSDGSTTTTPGTLMGFVENGETGVATQFANSNVANLKVTPGIDLDNPSTAINDGNISILSNWNLGAGSSPTDLSFRFNGQAPVITFRAVNNVQVDASLSDGFFQISNPTAPPLQVITVTAPAPQTAAQTYTAFYYDAIDGYNNGYYSVAYQNKFFWHNALTPPALANNPAFNDPVNAGEASQEIQQYYGLYQEYLTFLTSAGKNVVIAQGARAGHFNNAPVAGQPIFTETAPTAAQELDNPNLYPIYLSDYEKYIGQLATWILTHGGDPYQVVKPVAPPVILTALIQSGTTTVGTIPTDNSPSPVSTSSNGLPLQQASLNAGASSSFRIVAGANVSSANPLALQAASMFQTDSTGSVTVDGHFAYVDTNGLTLLAPTTIRTGVGSIEIAAANNVTLQDTTAPAVIYAAGTPESGAISGDDTTIVGNGAPGIPNTKDTLLTPAVNPEAAGNVSIQAQNDITGIENVTNANGQNASQFWSQWLSSSSAANASGQSSINFGAFDQGVMSVGGNVSVSAGGNIRDLAVSLPTTWYLDSPTTFNVVGGGNLIVAAGADILSGDYFVARGNGVMTAGGQIAPDFSLSSTSLGAVPIATLLATQDGTLNVSARLGANIGGVSDPSPLQSYSTASALTIQSTTGDVQFGTVGSVEGLPSSSSLPASLELTAFTGGITVASGGTLAPSPTGELSLIAGQSINISDQSDFSVTTFGMSDANPANQPSPLQPNGAANNEQGGHDNTALHGGDLIPARIYSLNGSITDGVVIPSTSGGREFIGRLVSVTVDKPAVVRAGQDIENLVFQGQNLRDDDVTSVIAGRDIFDSPFGGGLVAPGLVLGGPGTFDVEAGRNIGPLTTASNATSDTLTGIDAIGNANNPNLPHKSANVQVLFGVGPGIDDEAFISSYIDPDTANAMGVPSQTGALINFMQQYDEGQGVDTGLAVDAPPKVVLTAGEAWSQFKALPKSVQQLFVEQVFFSVLTDVGNDFNNPASPFFSQYARGFTAINTLFPASLGYTANSLGGGTNGSNAPVHTGDLDIRSSTIQTQQGGNVSILGPGGQALVGSSSAPPAIVSGGIVIAGPGTMGVLTLEQGNINVFTDQSLLLAQSRVFTEQGGDITIWSSNGNINAGQGSTTVADIPPPLYVCDVNHFCALDAKGEVTGAGIGTLQTIAGAPPGDANLLAPRGFIDAGAAGIRVSGNLNVAAIAVLNAANIQVQGQSTGIPVAASVDTGALTAASAATSGVTAQAQNLARNNASQTQPRHWVISVQVEGFGDADDDDSRKKRKPVSVGYNASSSIVVLGFGGIGDAQRAYLTREERSKLGG
ncbi:hypothetical protein GCM10027093_63190 [Paraburkholderia jirisanensis]